MTVSRSRPPARRALRTSGLLLLLLLAELLASTEPARASADASPTPARESDVAPIRVEVTLSDGRSVAAPVDRELADLRARLQSLHQQTLAPSESIEGLFSVPLERASEVDERIPLLQAESAQLRRQLATLESLDPGTPGRDDRLVHTRVRLDIATARLDYLEALAARLRALPGPASSAFADLASPPTALRARSALWRRTGDDLAGAGQRLDHVAARIEAGGLVGFVVEARELETSLRGQADALADRGARFVGVADALARLADSIEGRAAGIRRVYLATAASETPSSDVDEHFASLVDEQRQLRREIGQGRELESDLPQLDARAAALATNPESIGTTGAARAVADGAIALLKSADDALDAGSDEPERWRLAFVNEAVALLATRISDGERARAYAFSTEIVSDIRSEGRVAWRRAVVEWKHWWETVPAPSELVGTEAGRARLLRGLAMLALILIGVETRRRAGRIATSTVRRLARWSPMRRHIGSLVRWAGLLQTVLPVAVLYPIYVGLRLLLGAGSMAGAVLGAVFTPFFVYVLGREILMGATRQITRGRPALVRLQPETRRRLLLTYARLGLIFAVAASIDALAELAVGPGRIVSLVDALATLWIGIWAGWAAYAWRLPLGEAWKQLASSEEPARERSIADWMQRSRPGLVLAPVALARVVGTHLARALAGRLSATEMAQRVRARFLRRRSRRAEESQEERAGRPALPSAYTDEFPLYPILGDSDALLVPREELVESVLDQLRHWRESRANSSLVLVGDKGSGKTTLAAMVAGRIDDLECVTHTLRGTLQSESQLLDQIARVLGHEGARSVAELAEKLCAGPERVVCFDEAHSIFLRAVGGYRAYDALVSLVNATPDRVFWILVFNRYTWKFLNESRGRVHYFRRLLELPAWSAAEIQDLIRRRTTRAGFRLVFSEVLRTDEIGSGGDLDLIDGSEAYFRLLWESSGGNPRIATCLWLDSLTPLDDQTLEVGLFAESPPRVLSEIGDDLVFALAAIAQRENLSVTELARTLNLPVGFAQFAVRFLSEHELIEPKEKGSDRVTLAPRNYQHVLRTLRHRHLLLE